MQSNHSELEYKYPTHLVPLANMFNEREATKFEEGLNSNCRGIRRLSIGYRMAARGLLVAHEWPVSGSFDRARGRSPSGLSKLKPRVCNQ